MERILGRSAAGLHSDTSVGRPVSHTPSDRSNDALIEKFGNSDSRTYGEHTARIYQGDVRSFASYLKKNGGPDLVNVRPEDADRYFSDLRDAGRSPNTVNRYHSALKNFYVSLEKEGYIETNPIASVKKTPGDNNRARVLTPTEISTLHSVLKAGMASDSDKNAARNAAVIFLMLYGGLQTRDILAIRIGHVANDFSTVIAGNRGVGIKQPDFLHAFKEHWARHAANTNNVGKPADHLFTEIEHPEHGITRQTLWHVTTDIGKDAGIEPLNAHMLRRTGAVIVYNSSGGNVRLTQKFMGHSDLSTTVGLVKGYENKPEYTLLALNR